MQCGGIKESYVYQVYFCIVDEVVRKQLLQGRGVYIERGVCIRYSFVACLM